MTPAVALLVAAIATAPAVAPTPGPTRAPASGPASDPRLALLSAMEAELARSMARLRLPGHDAPYFVSYQLREVSSHSIAARHGALVEDRPRRDRRLLVDVRVGSYASDSSGTEEQAPFTLGDAGGWSAPREAPLDDDPAALRNALWLLTDERYKEALTRWFEKRGRDVHRPDVPGAPSFSREAPSRHVYAPVPAPFDAGRWRADVRAASAALRADPAVLDGTARVEVERQVRWFTSSEGSAIVTEQALYAVHLAASTRAPDGQLLETGRDFYGRSEGELPGREALLASAREMLDELGALRAAPAADPYAGPAILSAEAAGVLFHEAVGHRLEGDRQDDDREGRTFKGQLGKPVLPTFLAVVDDPTLRESDGASLNGHYLFDEQGVPAQRAELISAGRLAGYLLSRKPVAPFERSNGHARAQGSHPPVARMSNLVVTSTQAVPEVELRRMLLAEARRQGKRFAFVVEDVSGGNTNTASFGYQAWKGVPRVVRRIDVETGKEELVRGVEVVGTPLAAVNRILATGDAPRIFNGYCGAESGYVPVSTVSPSVLVSEIELQRTTRAGERAPILPPPQPPATSDPPTTPAPAARPRP